MKSQMQKFKNYLLDLNFLRKSIGFQAFLSSYSKNIRLKILEKPKSGRVLVLAPHPDDEAIGLGGTIIKHIDSGDKLKIVYLTDNKKNRALRAKEAKKAAHIMGVKQIEFCHFKDGKLFATKKEIKKILSILLKFKPKIIYVPFFLDPHPDHQMTARILKEVFKKSNLKAEIYSYEIWTPLLANRIIKIDDVISQKILAIKAYKSQNKERGYLGATLGLNSYRAGMHNAGDKAEAFFKAGSELYISIIEKYI